MLTRRSVLAGISAVPALAFLPTALWAQGSRPLVITDARGDYGLLAPYAHAISGPGWLYTSYVFDTLVDQDDEGQLVPGLAQSWQVSEDHLSWELALNPAARWHDGQPVTAADVVFTFDYMRSNPHPFVALDLVEAVESLAEDRIRINLSRPDSGFAGSTLVTVMVLPRHIYEHQPVPGQFTDPVAATGSGPYRLVRFDKAQGRYLLERNPDYYRGTPRFDQVAIVRMTPEAALAALRGGEIDVISDLPYDLVPQAEAAGVIVLTTASNHPERLVFNHRGLFASRDLRQALAHAINRPALADIAYRGAAVPAAPGYFQPGSPWASETPPPGYDYEPEKGEALLQGQGWERDSAGRWTSGGELVQLRLLTDGRYSRAATVLAEQLDAFGLAIDLRVLEVAALQQEVQADAFDLMLRATSTIGDPGAIVSRVLGRSWSNDRYPDPAGEMRGLLEAQAATADPQERLRLLHGFEALYAQELPSLMLVNALWAMGHNDRVSPTFLPDGVASGIPMAVHKSMFFR